MDRRARSLHRDAEALLPVEPAPAREGGFTLLEVSITLSMIAIGLLALVGTLSSMIELGDERLVEIQKSVHAQTVITELESAEFTEIADKFAAGTGADIFWLDADGRLTFGEAGDTAVATGQIEVFATESAVPSSFGGNDAGLDLDADGVIEDEAVADYQILPVRIILSYPNEPGVPDDVSAYFLRP